jgi:hypothetical protein
MIVHSMKDWIQSDNDKGLASLSQVAQLSRIQSMMGGRK